MPKLVRLSRDEARREIADLEYEVAYCYIGIGNWALRFVGNKNNVPMSTNWKTLLMMWRNIEIIHNHPYLDDGAGPGLSADDVAFVKRLDLKAIEAIDRGKIYRLEKLPGGWGSGDGPDDPEGFYDERELE